MKKVVMCAAVLSAVIISSSAFAEHHGDKGKFFDRVDGNKDGVVTESEFLTHAKERYSKMDSNGDGKVTKDEARAHHKSRREKWQSRREERRGGREDD